MILGMEERSIMHQDFVQRIEEAEDLAARCTNERDRVGWRKIADHYRKQLSRLETPAKKACARHAA